MKETNFKEAQIFVEESKSLGQESMSGPGSTLANAAEATELIVESISRYNIKSILDLGCGDWNWFQHINLEGIEYQGWDAHMDMIIQNQFNHGESNINFYVKDIIQDSYPDVDLIICRDVLFHMPIALANHVILKSKSACKYFISTSFRDVNFNTGIPSGSKWGYYSINLNQNPFNLSTTEIKYEREMLGASHDGIVLSPKRYICLYDFSNFQKKFSEQN